MTSSSLFTAALDEAAPFQVRSEDTPHRITLYFRGELDSLAAPIARDCLQSAFYRRPGTEIVVVMDDVSLLGSRFLHELYLADQEARAMGIEFVIREPSPVVRRMLDVASRSVS